ncbi:Ryanodine receptor Ryr [candidate division KSB1 bacterium]|nr:Ryanodine receptor Ryr [candidate division KSB1 bacterium]
MNKSASIDTSASVIPAELLELLERLAEHNHNVWVQQRINDGWSYGVVRDDRRREHPDLVAYDELPESEKEYDRNAAKETIKAILALGFRIEQVNS